MSEKRKVTMDDALAAGDRVILAAQAARIEELEAQRDELLWALRKIWNMAVPVQKEEHRIAREAIAKARGEDQ